MKPKLIAAIAAFLFLLIVCAGLAFVGAIVQTEADDECQPDDGSSTAPALLSPKSLTVKGEKISVPQARNAAIIIGVARANELPAKAAVVAIETSMQESTLVNIPFGYPGSTSVGLFQQIAAWGPYTDRMNPRASTRMFFFGGQAGQSGLTDIHGWEKMSPAEAAQAVQRSNPLGSGDPVRDHAAAVAAYDQHEDEAMKIVAAAGGSTVSTVSTSTADCEESETDPIELAVRAALSRQGEPYGWKEKPFGDAKFMKWAFGEAGITLPGSAGALATFVGNPVEGVSAAWISASDIKSGATKLQRGDLVFKSATAGAISRKSADHVSLYVGEELSESGSGLRIATYNVQGKSHTPLTGPRSWSNRIEQTYRLITERIKPAVVGLQELQPDQRTKLMRLMAGKYDIYPKRAIYGGRNNASVNSIIWDATRFRLVKNGGSTLKMPFYFHGERKRIPLVKLEHIESGKQFYVTNTHDPAKPRYARLRRLNALQHVRDMDRLALRGLPVFFTGDFNSGFGLRSSGNVTYRNRRGNLTWCIMTRSGTMWNAYDADMHSSDDNRRGECPEKTTKERGIGPVDHIYASSDVGVTNWTLIKRSEGTASDHPVVYADMLVDGISGAGTQQPRKPAKSVGVVIGANRPTSRISERYLTLKGVVGVLRLSIDPNHVASGGWVFPLSVGTYTFNHNSYGPRILGGDDFHNGTDFGTNGGTPPLHAMHGGKVVRMGWGGAWGNYYVVETSVPVPGMPGSTYKFLYAHLSRYASGIRRGSTVKAGQYVGNVGNTGNSFGEHLHLTICTSMTCTSGDRIGSTDPIPFLDGVSASPKS